MIITKFKIDNFNDFMCTLKDFEDSLNMWGSDNITNTWDLEVKIGDNNEYIIYVTIDESKNKSK